MFKTLKALFGFGSTEEPTTCGLADLQALLHEREATLKLTAEYGTPTVSKQGEPTAVFPITLYHEGSEYGAHAKEFLIPDAGLSDEDAPLTKFLNAHGVTSIGELRSIEGMTDNAELDEAGDINVTYSLDNPSIEEETDTVKSEEDVEESAEEDEGGN